MAKKTKIKINPKNKGKFTKSAKAAGKSVQEHAHDVMKNPNATPLQKKRANFAIQAKKWHHKKFGGLQYMDGETGANLVLDVPEFFPGDEGYYEPGGEGYMGGADNLYNSSRFSSPMFQPLKKQKIGVPEIKQAPNFKQTIKTPQINSYDFYDPQTGNINQPQNNNTKFSEISSYIPTNSIFNNYYLNKGNQFRKKAIDSFSKLENGGFNNNDYWNLGSGIANAVTADINTAKGFTDIAGTFKTNAAIKQIEAQNKRQNLFSQYENPTPTFQNSWGGNNPLDNGYIPVGEYGMSIKEIGGKGFPNVEVEGSEHIHLPNGFSEEIQGASHSEGGIPLNLPQGSKVLSEKLKHPETGKSYANMAKKFQTKKDFKNLESKFSDKINKETANLNIDLKNKALDNLFLAQEVNKLTGVHGKKPQESAIEDYTMKYGGMKKMSGDEGANIVFNYNIKPNKRKLDPLYNKMRQQVTPTGVKYEPPSVDVAGWKNIENQLNIAHPNGIPFTDNTQGYYGNIKDQQQLTNLGFQEQYYDDMLETPEGRAELAKMWESKGKTLKGINLPTTTKGLTALGDKDLYEKLNQLRPAYLDSYPKVRKGEKYYNPNPPVNFKKQTPTPVGNEPSKINLITGATETPYKKGVIPAINTFQLPDAYLRDPITVNNLNQEFYQPTTISPYLNDIQRLQYASNANLGTSGAELATRANLFRQGLTEYGKRYYDASTFNAQVKTQAAKDNAQTKQAVNQFNLNNYITNARNPQLQREANITMDKRNRQYEEMLAAAKKDWETRAMNKWDETYNPEYAFNSAYMNPSNQATKKFGGKVKIKSKKK